MPQKIRVNGTLRTVSAAPETPLLWVIREEFGLTGTKYGCGVMACGACTVLIDERAQRTCALPVGSLSEEQKILTIEGLSGPERDPIQKAWVDQSVPQCGYCQSGMVMAAVALLHRVRDPTDQEIDEEMTNICRCGTYQLVRSAIKQAAKGRSGG